MSSSDFPVEPSGIVVHGNKILVVGDDSDDVYFEYPLSILDNGARITRLVQSATPGIQRAIGSGDKASMESIAIRGGDVVALSEPRMRIVGVDVDWLKYGNLKKLRERGGRGLEGLAVRTLDEDSFMVAVAHERARFPTKSEKKRPLVLVHRAGREPMDLDKDTYEPKVKRMRIRSPYGDSKRFRCADLVWCWSTEKDDWTLLLLLSRVDKEKNDQKYLHEYDLEGNPVGEPRRLVELGMPIKHVRKNWEGLCWYENQLLLVNDTDDPEEMFVARLDAPPNVLPDKP